MREWKFDFCDIVRSDACVFIFKKEEGSPRTLEDVHIIEDEGSYVITGYERKWILGWGNQRNIKKFEQKYGIEESEYVNVTRQSFPIIGSSYTVKQLPLNKDIRTKTRQKIRVEIFGPVLVINESPGSFTGTVISNINYYS